MLMYVEKKTHAHDGPAWIGHAGESHTGSTLYFNGHAFRRVEGGGKLGNFVDIETGEEYTIHGPKHDGGDRHFLGSGKIFVERAALEEYLELRGLSELPEGQYEIVESLPKADVQRFRELENSGAFRKHEPSGRQTA